MKNLVILIALVFGIAVNSVMADNVKPFNANNVALSFQAANQLVISVSDAQPEYITVHIYNSNFELVATEALKANGTGSIDMSALANGHYIVKVEKENRVLHTEVIKNAH